MPRPSASMVVASTALVVALAGSGYAAVTLAKDSVGAREIRANAVRAAEIAPNAVGTAKVRNGSLKAEDFAPGQLRAGATGAQGPQGERGPSDALVAGTETTISLSDLATPPPVATATLGAGSWVILAGGEITHSSGGEALAVCTLNAGGTAINHFANVFAPGAGPTTGSIGIRLVRTYSAPATVTLVCNDHMSGATGDANMTAPQIIAVKVATVTGP